MERVHRALARNYGRQVPSGMPVYGWMFWIVGVILTVLGIGAFADGSPVIGGALVAGGLLLIVQTFFEDVAG